MLSKLKILIFLFLFSFIYGELHNQTDTLQDTPSLSPPFLKDDSTSWADSVFNKMSSDERIAQLFMVAAYSNKGPEHVNEITNLIEKYKIGGLIFFQGGPVRQAKLNNKYQSIATTPLLISIDAEWGLAMRLDSTTKFPRQMTLGAIQNDSLIYKMGAEIARQCKRLGIHVNLAPVADVNNNPKNPVINSRSFGEDRDNVARKAVAYMRGMQDNGIIATGKHFPGHGDTDSDSHKTLPLINHSKNRLDSIELYPFKELIKQGIGGIMIAHLYIPSLDATKNLASTLSKPIVTGLLKNEMKFSGLVFTDALNMKGVSAFYKPGMVDVKALIAGNDVLLFAEDVPTAIGEIKKAIDAGEISQEEIDSRCKKILYAKQWVGLDKYQPVKLEGLYQDLNTPQAELIKRELVEASLSVLKNEDTLIPLKRLDTLRIASVAIGETSNNVFQKTLSKYATIKHYNIEKTPSKENINTLLKQLEEYNLVIVSIHNTNEKPWTNFGITQETINLVNAIHQKKKVVLDLFANPYCLKKFYGAENAETVVMSFEDNDYAQNYSAQLIFGGIATQGTMPITASSFFFSRQGIKTASPTRLKYTIPEEVSIDIKALASIDDIALNGIKDHAYPGCQILIAKEGKVFYQKSFGYHTYENKIAVKDDDIYDLASITKIAASLLSIMKLQDEEKININNDLCDYLADKVDSTPYMNMNIRDMLAHKAGLKAWIPFYQRTLFKGQPKYEIYSIAPSETYPYRVANRLYINKDYPDSIFNNIISTPLNTEKKYLYSDIGYYFMQKMVERVTSLPLNEYVQHTFYTPLGLSTTGYHPRDRFELDRIAPTEYDMLFRKQLIHGDVHDPGAAMMGGVAGHAGVFSSANDLAKLMQMYLNWGEYGGERYIEEKTVKEFSKCQFCEEDNRRGVGFDKPVRDGGGGPTCNCVSWESFGHTGFTGTIAWVDPDKQVVYIFLSNRVYPDANNKKLITMGIRSKIQQVIYDAIGKK